MKRVEYFLENCRASGCDLVLNKDYDMAITASMLQQCGKVLTVATRVNGAVYTEEMPDFAFPEGAFESGNP